MELSICRRFNFQYSMYNSVTSGSLRFSAIATSTGRLPLENSSYALVANEEEDDDCC